VHAPSDSFPSWYFRSHGCGVIADREDPENLAAAIDRLCTDQETRRKVSVAARAAAERDYDLDKVRRSFESLIREVVTRNGKGTREK
jgi:glycosyltransferase involved in cell wall biosynthesis